MLLIFYKDIQSFSNLSPAALNFECMMQSRSVTQIFFLLNFTNKKGCLSLQAASFPGEIPVYFFSISFFRCLPNVS